MVKCRVIAPNKKVFVATVGTTVTSFHHETIVDVPENLIKNFPGIFVPVTSQVLVEPVLVEKVKPLEVVETETPLEVVVEKLQPIEVSPEKPDNLLVEVKEEEVKEEEVKEEEVKEEEVKEEVVVPEPQRRPSRGRR